RRAACRGCRPACASAPRADWPPTRSGRAGACATCRRCTAAARRGWSRTWGLAVYRPPMSRGPVIGVDAGGTKLLAGVIHEDLTVCHRVRRLWGGGDRAEVLDTMVEAVLSVGEASAVGFGIPALLDFSAGVSVSSVHLPLD